MSSTLVDVRPPLILVVDDDADARHNAVAAFEDQGCRIIDVSEPDAAIQELRSSPALDLVYTDVRLGGDDRNFAGIHLGAFVKAERPDLPVVLYSTMFREEEQFNNAVGAAVAHADFDLVLPRGGSSAGESLAEQVSQCVAIAERHRDARAEPKGGTLGDRPDVTFSVARELVLSPDAAGRGQAILRDSGYSLRILSLVLDEWAAQTQIVVWLVETARGWEAELYRHPNIRAHGDSEDEALKSLVSRIPEDYLSADSSDPPDSILDSLLGGGDGNIGDSSPDDN